MARNDPNYSYLVKWAPSRTSVNREAKIKAKMDNAQLSVKKDIYRSLILVSLILCLQVVVYLVWNKYLS